MIQIGHQELEVRGGVDGSLLNESIMQVRGVDSVAGLETAEHERNLPVVLVLEKAVDIAGIVVAASEQRGATPGTAEDRSGCMFRVVDAVNRLGVQDLEDLAHLAAPLPPVADA